MLNTWKGSIFFTVAVFVLSMLDCFVLFVSEEGPCYWQLVLDECCLGVQKAKKQSASIELRTCNNILTLAQVKSQYNPCLLVAGDQKMCFFLQYPWQLCLLADSHYIKKHPLSSVRRRYLHSHGKKIWNLSQLQLFLPQGKTQISLWTIVVGRKLASLFEPADFSLSA
jgi:hypothetical protein